jgi:hypothetical protein
MIEQRLDKIRTLIGRDTLKDGKGDGFKFTFIDK